MKDGSDYVKSTFIKRSNINISSIINMLQYVEIIDHAKVSEDYMNTILSVSNELYNKNYKNIVPFLEVHDVNPAGREIYLPSSSVIILSATICALNALKKSHFSTKYCVYSPENRFSQIFDYYIIIKAAEFPNYIDRINNNLETYLKIRNTIIENQYIQAYLNSLSYAYHS